MKDDTKMPAEMRAMRVSRLSFSEVYATGGMGIDLVLGIEFPQQFRSFPDESLEL
jgi:hypothetical protein